MLENHRNIITRTHHDDHHDHHQDHPQLRTLVIPRYRGERPCRPSPAKVPVVQMSTCGNGFVQIIVICQFWICASQVILTNIAIIYFTTTMFTTTILFYYCHILPLPCCFTLRWSSKSYQIQPTPLSLGRQLGRKRR